MVVICVWIGENGNVKISPNGDNGNPSVWRQHLFRRLQCHVCRMPAWQWTYEYYIDLLLRHAVWQKRRADIVRLMRTLSVKAGCCWWAELTAPASHTGRPDGRRVSPCCTAFNDSATSKNPVAVSRWAYNSVLCYRVPWLKLQVVCRRNYWRLLGCGNRDVCCLSTVKYLIDMDYSSAWLKYFH